jgi:serine/threonine-protein kinase
MRICPSCGFKSTDDANFCPMCATKMPPAAAEAPTSAAPVQVARPDAATATDSGATAVAGRFLLSPGRQTPTGMLHEARDTQAGGATVAVKMVPSQVLPTAQLADRALRELKQLGKVSSDRIVKVIDQGRGSDGLVYMATEAAPGPTLEEVVAREGALSVERATAIVLQVGEALTEAQKVGVIHRDVAPRNVFIGPGDKVKVGDFGIAEPVSDKVFGSPAFLSPEQVEGKPVDQRSNIYSLGATYYFALTGKPPFDPTADGNPQGLLQQHLHATPQPPSARRQGVPGELDRIVLKALEKSGGRRHLTLRQLLSEIEAAAQKGAAVAAPESSARTVVDNAAPSMAAPPAPQPRQMAATVMGMASPMGAPPAASTPSGAVTRPNMPAQPAPQAQAPATTPSMPAAAAPTTAPSMNATPIHEQPTRMAEAPRVAAAGSNASPPVKASPQVQAAVAAAQASVAAKKAAAPAPAAKGGFRETAWFKKGEIEEEMAKAQAAAGDSERTGTTGEHAVVGGEVDQSKLDINAQDKARLSLKTGATQAMPVVKSPADVAVPGDTMSEQEMLAEMNSSKKWLVIAGIGIGVVVLAVVLWLVLGGKKDAAPAKAEAPQAKPEAVAAAPPATPPSPTGSPPAATPTPAAPPTPTPPPPAAQTPEQTLADAESAAKKGNLALAVDNLTRAYNAGASTADVRKLHTLLIKTATNRQTVAKKKKDKAALAEATALVTRLKSIKLKKK